MILPLSTCHAKDYSHIYQFNTLIAIADNLTVSYVYI